MTPINPSLYASSEMKCRVITDKYIFEHWVVIKDDGDHAQVSQCASSTTQDILSLQP